MSNNLLLKNSLIFNESNLIDRIRQSSIDIENNSNENEIHDFLHESFELLQKDIPNDVAEEIFSAILSCFSLHCQELTKEIDMLLNISKMNANCVLVTSSVIFYLSNNQPQLLTPECQSFVNDALNEILLQIKNITSKEIVIIFGHEIPSNFINDLINNILLSSKMTSNIISNLFPYILYQNIFAQNTKFDLLFENISNFSSLQVLPQEGSSNEQIYEFITNKNFKQILTMDASAFSLIQAAILYAMRDGNYNAEGITEENILPFIAIVMIYIEKSRKTPYFSFRKYKDLIANSVQILVNSQSSVLNASIDFILQNQFKVVSKQLISNDEMIQLFFILTKQLINYQYSANKLILLNSIFSLTSTDNFEMLSIFYNEFIIDLFNYILQNFKEIDDYDDLKKSKLNLMFIESTMIVSYFTKFTETNDLIQFVYFLEKFCYNQPIIVSSPEISGILMKAINDKIKEESWDDVILIGEFMKKNDFSSELFELNERSLPKLVKQTLFNCIPDENSSNDDKIDYLLSTLLSDPNLEKNDSSIKSLFELMIKDEEILQSYLSSILSIYHNSFTIDEILKFFKKEYELYSDKFIDVINRMFYNNQKVKKFIVKESFSLSSLPISKFGQSIIFKLFDKIKKKPGNYEAFICLKHISSSFYFLFDNIFDETCEIVSSNIKKINLLLEKDENEENCRLIKTTYAAISFMISVLQSSSCNDQFFKWVFNNLTELNDDQLLGFLIIIDYIFQLHRGFIFVISIMKYNIFEKIGHILERKSQNKNLSDLIKQKTYLFLLRAYRTLNISNNYILLQIDEFYKHIDNFISYSNDFIFSMNTYSLKPLDIQFNGIPENLNKFRNDLEKKRDFWIDYPRLEQKWPLPTIEEINEFYKKLSKHEPLTDLPNIQRIKFKISIKMARYLVLKKYNYYSWILYEDKHPFVVENKEEITKIINDLTEMQNQAKENPDNDENKDADLFNGYDYIFPLYCQQTLFRSLVKNLTDHQPDSNGNKYNIQVILLISGNQVSFLSFLEFISQYFSEIYDECNDSNINSSIESMIKLLNALIQLSEIKRFQKNFVDLCGNNIINIILKPKLRNNRKLLLKTIDLFLLLKKDLPIRITQLICIMLSFKDIDMKPVFELIKKFDYQQLSNVKHYIFNCFEREKEKLKISPMFVKFVNIYPSIIQDKNEELITLLDNMLQKYFSSNENENFEKNQDISSLVDILAPKRSKSTSIMMINNNSITIPEDIKETSPSFWNLIEKYGSKIFEKIESQPFILSNFKFLCEYPELIDFKIRSSYFRKKMKNKINQYGRFPILVNRKNILSSSYKEFLNKSTDQILKSMCVNFDGERSIDAGGPTREWFTALSKELMNQNYGLFECSKNTKCYQPSRFSDVNPNHIDYFKFAGKFIARALIEGQCIDAHFTTSFYKQILKCEVSYKDIEDFDEELYQGLEWLLQNDVDSLCMFFEIDIRELGVVKTVELKENGSKIKVTNENKAEYVNLRANYALKDPIELQVKAFCSGFYSLIDYEDIKMFTPKELDLLICGIPEINASDFIAHTKIDHPYNSETPVIKYFFDAISKWENDKLAKLLLFMTGSSRVPSNGFKEFCEMSGSPLRISFGGDKSRIPQSHTCFNTIDLPEYESVDELNEKLILAIEECNTFEMS